MNQQKPSGNVNRPELQNQDDLLVNKVAQSGLVTIDLEELYLPGERVLVDLKDWMFQELIIKEKDFREKVKDHNWQQYQGKFVALFCTADAIIPTWAFMLVASRLEPVAKKTVFGTMEKLEEEIFLEQIAGIDLGQFKDQRVVIKGCSMVDVPVAAYVFITNRLRPVAKSIMYGEACSTVPVYKKKD